MKSAVTRTWYRIAVARPRGTPLLVAAQGEHLGVAIAAAEQHVDGGHAIACAVAADGVPLGESVGKQQIVELGDAADEVAGFRWPVGVLPELGTTAALGGAARGWVHHAGAKLFVLEAMTDHEHLADLFLGMIERTPAADNLEVRVLDHFENTGTTDVWLTSRVDAKRILRFLDDHDAELIDNGHVELSIYIRKHKATLRLTEHKTVVWIADTNELETEVTGWFKALGVPQVAALAPIARAPHFHFRRAKSRDRKKLNDQLFRQRLRRVDKVARVAPPERAPDTDG